MTYDLILPLDGPAISRSEASAEAIEAAYATITYNPDVLPGWIPRCHINCRSGRPAETVLYHLSAALRQIPADSFQIMVDVEYLPTRNVNLWSSRAADVVRTLRLLRKTPRTLEHPDDTPTSTKKHTP